MRTPSLLALLTTAASLAAQGIEIYSHGPLVTHPGAGLSGADVSALQNVAPLNLTTYGWSGSGTSSTTIQYSMIDDFAINGLQIIDGIELFTYQTGLSFPSISSVQIEIYNDNPSTIGVPIAGSPGFANNLFTTAGYTVTNTMANINRTVIGVLADANRPLQSVRIDFAVPLILDPGTLGTNRLWLEFRFGSVSSTVGPWVPPITVLDSGGSGADALQRAFTIAGGTSTFATPLNGTFGAGMPFKLYGIPTTLPGSFSSLPGSSSGALTFEVRGAPQVGGVVHAVLSGVSPLAAGLIFLGVSDPNQSYAPFCTAVQRASLDYVSVYAAPAGPVALNWQLPMIPSAVGWNFFMQGAQVDPNGFAPGSCDIPGAGFTFDVTDGVAVQFY